jgi:hypothetical protein
MAQSGNCHAAATARNDGLPLERVFPVSVNTSPFLFAYRFLDKCPGGFSRDT